MTFTNYPFVDFSKQESRQAQQQALNDLTDTIHREELYAAPIIDGAEKAGDESFFRKDPSNHAVTLGKVRFAPLEEIEPAVLSLLEGKANWAQASQESRSAVVHKIGLLIERDANALRALLIREAGKSWREADGELAEAIDFCHYYAEQALSLAAYKTQEVAGEENVCGYRPRGLAVVISPWNFPFAITCGMTVAALVTGNTVALKPSEQTSIIAFQLAHLLLEAGIPPNAFAFLPGRGEILGRTLVAHPSVDMIAFTGSKAVGLEIIQEAAKVRPGQRNVKRVVAEMGGKNAIIIDGEADIELAIEGVIASTFGYAGQKCSACSRLIIVQSRYEETLTKLLQAVEQVTVGEASDPSYFYGPVIDEESQARLRAAIAQATSELSLLFAGQAPTSGCFVAPHIFKDVPTSSTFWNEELFGPVLCCTRAKNFSEALAIANNSAYGLTGGVFSSNPAHLALAKKHYEVGNLYLNRKITGAFVERQPFGGSRMSGIGSKAGGKDYLLQFVEPYTWSENKLC